jgi:hypothetical protein
MPQASLAGPSRQGKRDVVLRAWQDLPLERSAEGLACKNKLAVRGCEQPCGVTFQRTAELADDRSGRIEGSRPLTSINASGPGKAATTSVTW